MTREEFEQLAGAGVILLDGATGSNLTKAGMPKGVSTELWVLEHPDILANLQKAYVEAGSQIVYAPTFGANRLKLADYGRENEVEELNARLVDISKKALAGTGALIAGDFSTPGKMLQPKGDLSYEELLESYTEQVTAVANAGVDLLVAEPGAEGRQQRRGLRADEGSCAGAEDCDRYGKGSEKAGDS